MLSIRTILPKLFSIALAICLGFSVNAQFHDGLLVEYGKNRVQYRNFEWKYHTQGEFEIYYYQGGKALAGDIASIVADARKAGDASTRREKQARQWNEVLQICIRIQ